jgi:hypothetical protein
VPCEPEEGGRRRGSYKNGGRKRKGRASCKQKKKKSERRRPAHPAVRINGRKLNALDSSAMRRALLLRRTFLVAAQQQQQQHRGRASVRVARTFAASSAALPEQWQESRSSDDRDAMLPTSTSTPAPLPPPPPAPPSYLHRTVFRRPLNAPAIAFSSPAGRELFSRALARGTAEGFFPLIEQYSTQDEPAYCGLASLAMVLNALNVDPRRPWKVST